MSAAAGDFKAECDSISAQLSSVGANRFKTKTQFKGWTITDIIGHLHLWNIAADLSLTAPDKFMAFAANILTQMNVGKTHIQVQNAWFDGKTGPQIFADWKAFYPGLAARFKAADPQARLKWVGPDMSASACIIARQMEHWAHMQAVYDVMGIDRVNTDGIKNIAHIGVTTYSWSFKVKSMTPILPKPYVRLTAPGGGIWVWNTPQKDNRVDGDAAQFCQVVTQCRNIGDTQLTCIGPAATTWMQIAQCFAGGAQMPPPPGARFKQT